MSIIQIPINRRLRSFEETVSLDNQFYVLQFLFNKRLSLWVMNILNLDRKPILSGLLLQTNVHLSFQYPHLNLPKGTFLVHDTQGKDKDPDDTDFGDRVVLLYEESTL